MLHACKLGITALFNAECYNIPATSVSLLLTTTMYLVLTPYKPYSLLFVLCWQWLNITSIKYKDHKKKHNIKQKEMQFHFLLPRKYCTFFVAMFEHSSFFSSSADQRFLLPFNTVKLAGQWKPANNKVQQKAKAASESCFVGYWEQTILTRHFSNHGIINLQAQRLLKRNVNTQSYCGVNINIRLVAL